MSFLGLIFITLSFSAFAESNSLSCWEHETSAQELSDVSRSANKSTCEKLRDSKVCQDLYRKIQVDTGTVETKILKCDNPQNLNAIKNMIARPFGCLTGVFEPIGVMLGEGAGAVVVGFEKNRERLNQCDKSTTHKLNLFKAYNRSAPALLKVPEPTTAKLESTSCAQLEADLYHAKKFKEKNLAREVDHKQFVKNATLTQDEKEYFDWKKKQNETLNGPNQSLWEMADQWLTEYDIKTDCYNPPAAWALRCEALFNIATVGFTGAKVGLAALSGLKAQRFVVAVQTGAPRAEILARAANLTDSERKIATAGVLGRSEPLSKLEKKKLIEAHNVPDNDISAKARKLAEGGFSKPERKIILENALAGSANDLRLSGEKMMNAGKFYESQNTFEAAGDAYLKEGKLNSAREYYILSGKPDKYVKTIKSKVDANNALETLGREVEELLDRRPLTAHLRYKIKMLRETQIAIYESEFGNASAYQLGGIRSNLALQNEELAKLKIEPPRPVAQPSQPVTTASQPASPATSPPVQPAPLNKEAMIENLKKSPGYNKLTPNQQAEELRKINNISIDLKDPRRVSELAAKEAEKIGVLEGDLGKVQKYYQRSANALDEVNKTKPSSMASLRDQQIYADNKMLAGDSKGAAERIQELSNTYYKKEGFSTAAKYQENLFTNLESSVSHYSKQENAYSQYRALQSMKTQRELMKLNPNLSSVSSQTSGQLDANIQRIQKALGLN